MNTCYFSAKQVTNGEANTFLNKLILETNTKKDYFNDIHVYSIESGDIIIEWAKIYWKESLTDKGFRFIHDEEKVVTERYFPDGHYELCFSDEDYEERLQEFLSNSINSNQ